MRGCCSVRPQTSPWGCERQTKCTQRRQTRRSKAASRHRDVPRRAPVDGRWSRDGDAQRPFFTRGGGRIFSRTVGFSRSTAKKLRFVKSPGGSVNFLFQARGLARIPASCCAAWRDGTVQQHGFSSGTIYGSCQSDPLVLSWATRQIAGLCFRLEQAPKISSRWREWCVSCSSGRATALRTCLPCLNPRARTVSIGKAQNSMPVSPGAEIRRQGRDRDV